MYDKIYGYDEQSISTSSTAEYNIVLPDKTKTISDYIITMNIFTELNNCEVISGIPLYSSSYTLSNNIIKRLLGNYFVSFIITDKATGKVTIDKNRLIVKR